MVVDIIEPPCLDHNFPDTDLTGVVEGRRSGCSQLRVQALASGRVERSRLDKSSGRLN